MYKMLLISVVLSVTGCANPSQNCEQILEVKEQQLECKKLQFQIQNNKNPQQVTEAKRRFAESCTDLRYYRDQYDTICKGNETPIGESKPQL